MPPQNNLAHAIHGPSSSGDGGDDAEAVQKDAAATPASRSHPQGVRGGTGFIDTSRRKGRTQSVFKQEVDRRSTIPPQLQRAVQAHNGVPKPYDAALLRDMADLSVAQAYIDTLAQDVAGAKWHLEPRDEDANVGESEIAEAERTMEDLHPEKSFRDILEQTTRNMLETGDAAWIKHYFSNGDGLAEVVPMDSARMFKRVNNHGLTEGYLQASFTSMEIVNEAMDVEEAVWFEWSSRTDHVYGHGPVEKGLKVIMLLEELSEKEKKDLMEGMPPGIVSAKEDADNPLPVDEYDTVKEEFEMSEGERHRVIVSRGEWDYTDFSGNYQELQILDREKFWINVLGAVMKVNPPYAGFDFQEGNKAQNSAQKEAYAQRGFRQTLRQLEEAITRQLVHPDLSEDLNFVFEREQTVDERSEQAKMLEQAATAATEWARAGRTVSVNSDGTLTIEEGDVEPGDVESEGGGGGGLPGFGASAGEAEAPEAPEEPELSEEEVLAMDDALLAAHKSQIWPESIEKIEKKAWDEDADVPQYVLDAIDDAIDAEAVFDDIKSLPGDTVDKLKDLLKDKLTQPQGWSLGSLVRDAKKEWPGVDEEDLEMVLRTETAGVLNKAREIGYEERPESGRYRFYWQGPDDQRTTDACKELKEETNPDYGGTPVPMPELKRKEREVHNKHFKNLSFRDDHTIHPHERHTFVRAVEQDGLEGIPSADDVVTEEEMERRAEMRA